MPKLGIEIENNIPSNVSDFKKLDKSVDRVGKSVDQTSTKIKGMGAGLSKALGAFAIGGAIQKGINIIANDIEKASANAVKNNRSSAQLFGQMGMKGVELARNIAVGEGADLALTQQLLNNVNSGSSASGVSATEQSRLVTLALKSTATGGDPTATAALGTQLFNAAPAQFAKRGGAIATTNLSRAISRSGDLPKLSDTSFAGAAIAAGAAADIAVPAQESAAVFTFLTTLKGKEKSVAGTDAAALLRKYQVLGGTMNFTDWLDSLIPLSAGELQKKLGDQGAVGAVLAIKGNPKGYRQIRKSLDDAVRNPQSIIAKEERNRLKVDKVFAATKAIDRKNVANSVGASVDENLAILQAAQTAGTAGDRFIAGGIEGAKIVSKLGILGNVIDIGEENEELIDQVQDRNIGEMARGQMAAEQIGALREVTGAVQTNNANAAKTSTDGGY